MKTVPLISLALVAACSRESRSAPPTTPPSPTSEPAPAEMSASTTTTTTTTDVIDPGAAQPQPVRTAIAVLHPTRGSTITGVVRFVEARDGRGLDVFAVGHGLVDSPHAFHVHVYGDCSAPDASSAGPHFHFTGSSFDDEVDVVTGNLGHLRKHRTGPTSTHHDRIEDATLQGPFSIIGRSIIVHERGNDPSVTPDGDAGARIACGVIGVADPRPPQTARR